MLSLSVPARATIKRNLTEATLEMFENMEQFDHIDFPNGAPSPEPTFMRRSSSDVCFSSDMGEDNCEPGVVWRGAHGTGTGIGSIGINPSEFKIHAMSPRLVAVAAMLTNRDVTP